MDILLVFVTVTVFTLMLTIGINQSLSQLASVWRRRYVLPREMLAALILVPAVAVLLIKLFDLSPAVAAGLVVLAAAPGAPMTTKRAKMAAADIDYVSSLQLALALSAIISTPAILAIFYVLYDLPIERVSPLAVAGQIARVTFLPVAVGLALQHFAPRFVEAIRQPLNKLANLLFLTLVVGMVVVLAVAPEIRAKLLLGWPAIASIALFAAAALAIGHLLGAGRPEQRAGLAIASVARNMGLALYIAGHSAFAEEIVPTLLAYMLLGAGLAIPYSLWARRQMS
jgi:BASS family bile acid:Na+ symporter